MNKAKPKDSCFSLNQHQSDHVMLTLYKQAAFSSWCRIQNHFTFLYFKYYLFFGSFVYCFNHLTAAKNAHTTALDTRQRQGSNL